MFFKFVKKQDNPDISFHRVGVNTGIINLYRNLINYYIK